jgi:hypothetical protein
MLSVRNSSKKRSKMKRSFQQQQNTSNKRIRNVSHPSHWSKYNEEDITSTILQLSEDELSLILSFLPIGSKLKFACTSRELFHMIDRFTRERLFAYDTSIPLSQLWAKYNEYTVRTKRELNDLKQLLQKANSFAGVTEKLMLHLFGSCISPDTVLDILCIPTSRNTTVQIIENLDSSQPKTITIPETMGHTMKHLYYRQYPLDIRIFNVLSKLESIIIDSCILHYLVIPEIRNTQLLTRLKHFESNLPDSLYQYFSVLMPNLKILRLSRYDLEFPRCFVNNCPSMKEIYLHGSAWLPDRDVLYILESFPELKKLEILVEAAEFTGSAFNEIGKYAKKLEYLHICRKLKSSVSTAENIEFSGGELPSLKYFTYAGYVGLLEEETREKIAKLYHSVTKNCPNIIKIQIYDFEGRSYPIQK